jgi:hypothetical protein
LNLDVKSDLPPEHVEFAVSRSALSAAIAAIRLPTGTGGDRRIRLTLNGQKVTLLTEMDEVQCSYTLPLTMSSAPASLAFEASVSGLELLADLREVRLRSDRGDAPPKWKLARARDLHEVVHLKLDASEEAKGHLYLSSASHEHFLRVTRATPYSAPSQANAGTPMTHSSAANLEKGLGHAAAFSKRSERDDRFSVVMVEPGRIFGGARSYLSSFESDDLASKFRVKAKQVRVLRSILRRMRGPLQVITVEGTVVIRDGSLTISFFEPSHEFMRLKQMTAELDPNRVICLATEKALKAALFMDCLDGRDRTTALELTPLDGEFKLTMWSTNRNGGATTFFTATAGAAEVPSAIEGRIRTEDLVRGFASLLGAKELHLCLEPTYALVEGQLDGTTRRHFLPYPSPELGPKPLPSSWN